MKSILKRFKAAVEGERPMSKLTDDFGGVRLPRQEWSGPEQAHEASELERCVQLVRDAGLPTGHAGTHLELVSEVLIQVEELRGERDAISRNAKETVQELRKRIDWRRMMNTEQEDEMRVEVQELRKRIRELEAFVTAYDAFVVGKEEYDTSEDIVDIDEHNRLYDKMVAARQALKGEG